nr:unnamed protein product [Callosobruchus analis]
MPTIHSFYIHLHPPTRILLIKLITQNYGIVKHHLKINSSKSGVLIFDKNGESLENKLDIAINNENISCRRSAKSLGAEIDSTLRLRSHFI